MADTPYYLLQTFAERKAAREAAEKKAPKSEPKSVDSDDVEDKAVAPKKTTRKRAAKKA